MWVSKAAYQRMLSEIDYLRTRVGELESALELERHENRLSERHLCNQLLRKVGSYPQQSDKVSETPRPTPTLDQLVDPGERDALREEALRLGIDPGLADEVLRKERGLAL